MAPCTLKSLLALLPNRLNKIMLNHSSQSAYDHSTGFAVKKIPSVLFQLLDSLVSSHLQLPRLIGSYSPEEYEYLLDALNHFTIKSRESRTLPEDACRSVSPEIIEQLSAIMPKPKRLHNNDIYYRVVIASEEQTISVPHRDEYFHRITPGWEFADDEESVKVWIPLFCPSEIALGIVPSSHIDYSHGNATYQLEDGRLSFQTPHRRSDLVPIKVCLNHCLIFPSMLIHGSLGVPALDPLRISVEISPVLST